MTDGQLTRFRAASVGFVFQEYNRLPDLTAQENVVLAMDAWPRLAPPERQARARKLLAAVGLQERSTHDPQHLSGGEKQRVLIARALANRPSLVLADEPSGNISDRAAARGMDLLRDLNQRLGVILFIVTHDKPSPCNASGSTASGEAL